MEDNRVFQSFPHGHHLVGTIVLCEHASDITHLIMLASCNNKTLSQHLVDTLNRGGGTQWKGGYADMRLRTVAFFAPQV